LKKPSLNFSNINDLTISEFPIAKLNRNTASISSIINNCNDIQNNLHIKKEISTDTRLENNCLPKNPNLTSEKQQLYNKNELLNNGMKTISNQKGIFAANKNSEKKKKLRNRVYNEEKFALNLYNPKNKSSVQKDLLNLKLHKNQHNSNKNQNFDFKTYNESESRVFNNKFFDSSMPMPNGDLISKRLRAKNKSFANTKMNWNNLIFTNKSQNILAKNNLINNKSSYRSKIRSIDCLLKLQLQSIEDELKTQTTKNIIRSLNKKSSETINANNNNNLISQKPLTNKINLDFTSNYNPNNLLLLNKKNFQRQKDVVIKGIVNSELINELQNYVKNQKEESITNCNNPNNKLFDGMISCSSTLQSNPEIISNLNAFDNKNNKRIITNNQKHIFKDSNALSEEKSQNSPNILRNNYPEESIKTINTQASNQNENIRILENYSDIIILNESGRYNKLNNTDINERNIKTNSNLKNCIDNEESNSILEQKNHNNFEQQKSNYSNNIQYNNQPNILTKSSAKEDSIEEKQQETNIINNNSLSNCSPPQYADDIEDMNTIIKRLNFARNTKNENSIFNLNCKIYSEFNSKFINEIDSYLFPHKYFLITFMCVIYYKFKKFFYSFYYLETVRLILLVKEMILIVNRIFRLKILLLRRKFLLIIINVI